MEDKSYWKRYSSVRYGKLELHINSGNGDWAEFHEGEYVTEGTEATLPPHLTEMYLDFELLSAEQPE